MTLGPTDPPPSPPPAGRLDTSDAKALRLHWWEPIAFWSIGIALAVVTWWPLGVHTTSGLQGRDTYTYFFPLKAWYADRLHAGELALWNPLIGHGIPSLGESQTGVFYPCHLLLYRFLPLNMAYHVNFLLHYTLAFGFTCHLGRQLRFSIVECILAGVIFVYGWFPARSCLEWAIVTGAWIPLAFCGVERFVAQSRIRFLLATEVALVMQLLAGHFNLAFVTFFGLAFFAVVRFVVVRRSCVCSLQLLLVSY